MDALPLIRRLWDHAVWSDRLLLERLQATTSTDVGSDALAEAWREYAHVLGAEEVWLSRLEGRDAECVVWPDPDRDAVAMRHARNVEGYARYLAALEAPTLDTVLSYRTSAGQPMTTSIGDILTHVALHGHYHRGKINLLLRQCGAAAAPADFISFARGAPAAVTPRTEATRW